MNYNAIDNIRLEPSFDNYEPFTDSQKQALATFQSIGDELVTHAEILTQPNNPLPGGRFIILSGGPGLGKTHLMESLINKIRKESPKLLDQIYLLRGTPLGYVTRYEPVSYKGAFDHKRIIMIDDLFSQAKSPKDLCGATEIKSLMSLITGSSEERNIIIVTCNFPFLKSLLPLIQQNDPTGRVVSRAYETIVTNAGEIEMEGPDYRRLRADMKADQPRSSFLGLDNHQGPA